MPIVQLSCPKKGCSGIIQALTQNVDQSLVCPRCAEVFMFFNVAIVFCGSCKSELEVDLNSNSPLSLCPTCGKTNRVSLDRVVRPRRFDEDNDLGYCGRDNFQNYESQVIIAKRAFQKIEAAGNGWFSRNPVKKGIFINRLMQQPHEEFRVENIRLLHAYCNFKRYEGHNNAKYLGLSPSFSSGSPFVELIKHCGLIDIWVCDGNLLQELLSFPKVKQFAPRIRILP